MARCGCAGTTCSCVVQGNNTSITVTGSGTPANPYVIDGAKLAVTDTPTINLTLTGNGSAASPYTLSGVATVSLDGLSDVSATAPVNGQVLAFSNGTWQPVAPVTAPPGVIATACGLDGDGSSGAPLQVQVDLAGYLACSGASGGLGLNEEAKGRLNRSFGSSNARDSAIPVPQQGMSVWRSDLQVTELFTEDGWVSAQALGSWLPWTPKWYQGDQTSLATGITVSGAYQRWGKTIEWRMNITLGATAWAGNTGFWTFALPVPARQIGDDYILGTAFVRPTLNGMFHTGVALSRNSTPDRCQIALHGQASVIGPVVPVTWGSGGLIRVAGRYEVD